MAGDKSASTGGSTKAGGGGKMKGKEVRRRKSSRSTRATLTGLTDPLALWESESESSSEGEEEEQEGAASALSKGAGGTSATTKPGARRGAEQRRPAHFNTHDPSNPTLQVHEELTEYDKQRQANIAKRNKLLASLGVCKVREEIANDMLATATAEKKRLEQRSRKRRRESAGSRGSEGLVVKKRYATRLSLGMEWLGEKKRKLEVRGNATVVERLEEREEESAESDIPAVPEEFERVARHFESDRNSNEENEKPESVLSDTDAAIANAFRKVREHPRMPDRGWTVAPERVMCADMVVAGGERFAVVGDRQGYLVVWDVGALIDDEVIEEDDEDEEEEEDGKPEMDELGSRTYEFRPTRRPISQVRIKRGKVYFSSYDGVLNTLDIPHQRFDRINTFDSRLTSMDFLHPTTPIVGDDQGRIHIVSSDLPVASHTLHRTKIGQLSLLNNSLLTCSNDRSVKLWDMRSLQEPVALYEYERRCITGVRFCQHGRAVASLFEDGLQVFEKVPVTLEPTLMIRHNTLTGRFTTLMRASPSPIPSMPFTYISSKDHGISLYSLTSGLQLSFITGSRTSSNPSVNLMTESTDGDDRIALVGFTGSGRGLLYRN